MAERGGWISSAFEGAFGTGNQFEAFGQMWVKTDFDEIGQASKKEKKIDKFQA